MELEALQKQALEIKLKYDALNKRNGDQEWDVEAYMQGFVGDVGDLAKLVMAKQGYRQGDSLDKRLEHELADCLWSVLVIAHELDIDLGTVFKKNMDDLSDSIDEQ